jgi:3-oxoacyl-(acyl-carrier-protein) synthase
LPEGTLSSSPREEPLSVAATLAVRQALLEAGIEPEGRTLDDVGLVMSTALGPSASVEQYLEKLRLKGPRPMRPALFVDTLLSMPASRVGIALKLRGSTAVLGASSALELAFDWVSAGRERIVVAGGGDLASPKCARYHQELARRSGSDRAHLGQAAAFLVLESEGSAREREAPVLGRVLGTGAASEPQEVSVPWGTDRSRAAFEAAMREGLAASSLNGTDVNAVVLAAGDEQAAEAEHAAIRTVFHEKNGLQLFRPKQLFGEALSASPPLGVLFALASLPSGHVALVNSFEMGGAITTVVLRAGS